MIKKVLIEPGCVSCGSCQAICSHVFVVERCAKIADGVDFKKYDALIREAAELCPVQVIKVEEDQTQCSCK